MSREQDEQRIVWALVPKMLRKLAQNSHKGNWGDLHVGALLAKLNHEVQELADALTEGDPHEIAKECADVANYAAMIADVAGREDSAYSCEEETCARSLTPGEDAPEGSV